MPIQCDETLKNTPKSLKFTFNFIKFQTRAEIQEFVLLVR